MRVVRTELADNDLLEIWLYIGDVDPDVADRIIDQIDARCESLSRNPQLGVGRDNLLPGVRCLIEGNYGIFYRISTDQIEILRILHGARDLAAIFQG